MREHTVTIEKMAFGGAGVGHVDGKVCFVPYTAIGDRVSIRIKSEKGSYLEGEVLKVLEPSTFRVDPPCPVFGRCGGCDWQHLDYPAQLRAKEDIFAEILWRTGRVERARIEPIIGAREPYGYRSRVQLKMRCANGKNHIGFFMTGSHYVVDIPFLCAISQEPINRTYRELCEVLNGFPESHRIPQIDISAGEDSNIILIFHYIGERRLEIIDFLTNNRGRFTHVGGVFLQSGRKESIVKVYGLESISYAIPESVFHGLSSMLFHTSRGGFSQVNYRQNSEVIDIVLLWVQARGKERVLDLYCGNGNFSLPLARYAGQVVGFEEYEQSIRDAYFNRDINNLPNAAFEAIDSVEGVRKLLDAGEKFDVVLLDPPRIGAAEAVKLIPLLDPGKIIYISCDPPTLARDVAYLKKSGYDVTKSRPIDMFPQTYHVESVTLLEKCG